MTGLGFSSFASTFFSSFCSPSFFGSDLSAAFVCFWMASLSCFFFWSTLPVAVVFSSGQLFLVAGDVGDGRLEALAQLCNTPGDDDGGEIVVVLLALELLGEDDAHFFCPFVPFCFLSALAVKVRINLPPSGTSSTIFEKSIIMGRSSSSKVFVMWLWRIGRLNGPERVRGVFVMPNENTEDYLCITFYDELTIEVIYPYIQYLH